jgi:arginine/lysine/ornithine decarboxylase
MAAKIKPPSFRPAPKTGRAGLLQPLRRTNTLRSPRPATRANEEDEVDGRPAALDLKDFFTATEARQDHWQQLGGIARSLCQPKAGAGLRSEAARLLAELEPLESYWAYPGAALMGELRERLAQDDAAAFARLAESISRALLRGSYRHDSAAWGTEAKEEADDRPTTPAARTEGGEQRPYFEVLIVRDGIAPEQQQRAREELRKLRRPEDPFVYEVVYVPSFEDAVIGAICNFNVQAVVIYDGFRFRSRFDMPVLRSQLARHLPAAAHSFAPEAYGTTLAKGIQTIRPELDVYMLTDRSVEGLAAQLDAKNIRRVFYDVEELMEIHLSILQGVNDRYDTPFFSTLKQYSRRPVGTFHALPVARGKSIFKSNWIQDMGHFYGANLFLAESSATTGGLDSLLEPTGNIKKAQEKAARCFGAQRVYFGTNGTSTSNKIVVQSLLRPGDIVLLDRNCHKSHHYGVVLAGALPVYLEAFPLNRYSMYGGVPLRTIKQALLDLKAEGKLDRVRMLDLTNCTFDGHMYNTKRVMEECLAIKPDLVFLWDEAWFSFARFSPFHRRRTGMAAAEALRERYRSAAYRAEYAAFRKKSGALRPADKRLLDQHLLPDPDKVRLRVYATQSTHKSLSSLRQGSMILVNDDDFDRVEEAFDEAFFTHTSTSPNQQILASLDVARRQAELEGYELVMKHTGLALRLRREVNSHPLISKYFRILTPAEMIPAELRASRIADYGPPHSSWKELVDAWDGDEFALDPTRLTLMCGTAGFDGTQFKGLLADRYDIQINKTSRNTVLLMTNINNTRSDVAYVIKVLADIARDLEARLAGNRSAGAGAFAARVKSLCEDVPDLPNFSCFEASFRANARSKTPEGDMRAAFYMAYDEARCEHIKITGKEIEARLKRGPALVSANFVIPYPPGFPIMVPGQVISPEIITFMRKLDVKEIHGYHAAVGLKVLKPGALKRRSTR